VTKRKRKQKEIQTWIAFAMRDFSKRCPDLTETTGNSGATPLMAQNIFSYDAAALDFF
jgi:hypothetical protein